VTRPIKLSLLCAALLLAACGGQDQAQEPTSTTEAVTSTTATPDTTVAEPTTTTTEAPATTAPDADNGSLLASLDASTEITSGRLEGFIEMTGLDDSETGVSEATILFSTSFNATGDSTFLMDMSSFMGSIETDDSDPFTAIAAGMFGEMEFRQIGETAYVKMPFFTAMLGAETEWLSMPADEGESFANDFQTVPTDPNEMIATFDEQGATVEEVGKETVNGVDATHYRVSLDIQAMDLTAEERAELAESGIVADGVIPLELWVSEAGFVVRMIMEIDGSGSDAPTGEQFDTMTFRYDFFDVNGDIVIEVPPASQVTSIDGLEDAFGFAP
jgi:hypothetical protein